MIRASWLADGQVRLLALANPPRNVLDRSLLAALHQELEATAGNRALKAVLLTQDGPHFSYGASVADHACELAPAMLEDFLGVVRALLSLDVPIVAAVRGQCLGGGLELALCATRIVVDKTAVLGVPEIRLGAVAPVASLLLPDRLGQPRAEDLLLSGRTVAAEEALRIGLVDEIAVENSDRAALAWIEKSVLLHSASSLRYAMRAARAGVADRMGRLLPALHRMYVDELRLTADAEEGVRAFVEKRAPRWSDR